MNYHTRSGSGDITEWVTSAHHHQLAVVGSGVGIEAPLRVKWVVSCTENNGIKLVWTGKARDSMRLCSLSLFCWHLWVEFCVSDYKFYWDGPAARLGVREDMLCWIRFTKEAPLMIRLRMTKSAISSSSDPSSPSPHHLQNSMNQRRQRKSLCKSSCIKERRIFCCTAALCGHCMASDSTALPIHYCC